jgi:PAS domain S-box-containing protein
MISVLYVDDEATLLDVAKIYLDRTGEFCVTTALSGPSALALLATRQFDAVISDYQMPEMDGIELLKRVRAAFPMLPFIIFTGKGREEIAIEAFENGADFYLQKGGAPKPQFKELAQKIKSAVGKRQAEDALLQSEEQFRALFDNANDAIFLQEIDADGTFGRYIRVNEVACSRLGYTRDELLAMSPGLIESNEHPHLIFGNSKKPERNGKTTFEAIHRRKDGSEFPVEVSTQIFELQSRKVALSIARDITERKRAELTIQQTGERLDAIINGSSIPQFVIDQYHNVVYWNKALEQCSGIKAADVIGTNKSWRAFYNSERPVIADLLIDNDTEKIDEWYKGKCHPSRYIDGAFEATDFFPHLGKNGTWMHFTAVAIRDNTGAIIGAIETLEDVTGRKQAENALRESEERYRNIVEDQTEFVCRFAPDGTHVFANDAFCRYFGKTRDNTIGKKFIPEVPAEDWERIRNHFQSLTRDHPVDEISHRIIMPDGQVRWQRWSDRAIFDDDGRIIEYQSVGRDNTDLKKAEEAVKLANQKLQLLASITRHDIMNQLTALKAYLDIAEDNESDPEKRDIIDKEQRIAATIEEQILFTRDYQKMGINAPAWQNVSESLLRSSRSLPMQNVKIEIGRPDLEIFADPLFEKVFYNLIDNSLRYGGEHMDTIRFSCKENEKGLVCSYEDSGIGIPPSDKPHVFERGFGHQSGLGMFLSREILTITGLTIIENGEFGKGARFEITVPRGAYRFSKKEKR